MVVRRDQRRRRVILDESLRVADDESVTETDSNSQPSRRPSTSEGAESSLYSAKVSGRRQLRTTDLVPKRPGTVALVMVLMGMFLFGLNALSQWAPGWERWIGAEGIQALSLTGAGSLGAWCLSFLLMMSALTCLQVFALRKHRRDDYRGTYQIWLWFTGLFLIGSMACVVPLEAISKRLVGALAGPDWEQPIALLVMVKLVGLSLLLVRGLMEVRPSWGTVTLVSAGWLSLTVAIGLELPALERWETAEQPVYVGNLLLGGAACLMLATLLFARFVYLQTQGLVKVPVRSAESVASAVVVAEPAKASTAKPKSGTTKKKKSRTPSVSDKEQLKALVAANGGSGKSASKPKSGPPKSRTPVPAPAAKSENASTTARPQLAADTLPADDTPPATISRSEKKRQRKQAKRNRRAA